MTDFTPEVFEAVAGKAVGTVADFLRQFPDMTALLRVKLSNGMIVVVGIEEAVESAEDQETVEEFEPGFR